MPTAVPTVLLAAPVLALYRSLRKRAGEVLEAARTFPDPGVRPQLAIAASRGCLALLALVLAPFACASCGLVDPKSATIGLGPIGLGVAVFAPCLAMISSDATPAGIRISTSRFVWFLVLWLLFALCLCLE